MGKYIEAWMQQELPRLQMILGQPKAGTPIPQPEGANTFAQPDNTHNIAIWDQQGNDARARYQPAFGGGEGVAPIPNVQPGDQGGAQPMPNTFGATPPAAPMTGPGQTMQQPNPDTTAPFQSRHKPTSIDDINTLDDLMPAIPDHTIKKAYDTFEKQLGGPQGVDQHVYQLTQRDPTALNKREKTELLIEFGLRLAAGGGTGAGFGTNVAEAGLGTMGSSRQMRAAKGATYEKEQDREEKAREADLRSTLLKEQIEKTKGDKYQLKTDADGHLIRVDMNTGTSQKVLGADGQPVKGNADSKEFASQVDRAAYEGAYCEGLDGDALKACKQRALMFSKGGAPELAFPELTRVKVAERIMTMMENPDNKRTKYTLPGGQVKAYADMTGDEKLAAGNTLIDRWNDLAHNKLGERTTAKPASGNQWGLSKDDLDSIKEKERVTLNNGAILTRRNGKIVQVDAKGNPISTP